MDNRRFFALFLGFFFFIVCFAPQDARAVFDPSVCSSGITPLPPQYTTGQPINVTLPSMSPQQFISPMVTCMANIDPSSFGLIPASTMQFMSNVHSKFVPYMQAVLLLAVVLFGFRLALGTVRQVIPETMKLLFKVAGIAAFYALMPIIYTDLLAAMMSLGDAIASASSSPGAFCATPIAEGTHASGSVLWARWDCFFGYLFGWTAVGTGAAGLAGFVFLLTVGWPAGLLALCMVCYIVWSMFFTVARFVHVFFISLLGLSFVFCLGYLLVPPLILGGVGYDYFRRWTAICLSYILAPVIMFGYMGLMQVGVEKIVFSGKYSVLHAIDPTATAGASQDPMGQPANNHHKDYVKSLAYLDLGHQSATGSKHFDDGTLSSMEDTGKTGTQYEANAPPMAPKLALDNEGLDTEALRLAAGVASAAVYVANIITALLTAALLFWIMFSMLNVIPRMASELAAQGSNSIGQAMSSAVLGQKAIIGTIETGMVIATAAVAAQRAAVLRAIEAAREHTKPNDKEGEA